MAVSHERRYSYPRRSHQRSSSNNEWEKSAEVIVAKSRREGLNDAGVKSWESLVPT